MANALKRARVPTHTELALCQLREVLVTPSSTLVTAAQRPVLLQQHFLDGETKD